MALLKVICWALIFIIRIPVEINQRGRDKIRSNFTHVLKD